jgi:TrpR-related protein YerC/YecD
LLIDLLTKKEIDEIAKRLLAARMLIGGCSYQMIEDKTRLSSRTIARINKWIKNGSGGYKEVISNNSHIKPVLR